MTATVDGQQSSQAPMLPPEVQLAEMLGGLWLWWMLYVVAERGVADLLADAPRTSVELAQATGCTNPRFTDYCGRLRASGCLPRSRHVASR